MIPQKIKDHLEEYISQEVYVQIAVIKGKEKVTTKVAIGKYFNSNHYKDLSSGKPYNHFIEGLKDKCLIKLSNSPMKNKETDDEVIKELQNKLNKLEAKELKDTYWEIETGEYLNGRQVKELEMRRDEIIKKLNLTDNDHEANEVYDTIISYCKKYEELCKKKYPEAPLPLEVLKTLN